MNPLLAAQAAAQLISLFAFATLARWYVAPWLAARPRADALAPLLWVHAFRYVALQAFAAQRLEGYKVPREVVFLDALPRTHLGKVDRGKLRAGQR